MKKPFFAKYLESQSQPQPAEAQQSANATKPVTLHTAVSAGRPITTLKYPSDRDE